MRIKINILEFRYLEIFRIYTYSKKQHAVVIQLYTIKSTRLIYRLINCEKINYCIVRMKLLLRIIFEMFDSVNCCVEFWLLILYDFFLYDRSSVGINPSAPLKGFLYLLLGVILLGVSVFFILWTKPDLNEYPGYFALYTGTLFVCFSFIFVFNYMHTHTRTHIKSYLFTRKL